MNHKQRIKAIVQLGTFLEHFAVNKDWENYSSGISKHDHEEFNAVIQKVHLYNGWFTEPMVRKALKAISTWLKHENLEELSKNQKEHDPKTVAIIMAGNIPLVGFHDALCVLLNGDVVLAKFSSDDSVLMPILFKYLIQIEPEFNDQIRIASDRLTNFDAVIATGSNNSARYFEQYFGQKPNIIRKNRTSVAVLDGTETEEELSALGNDVFDFFGLGCRNVTKLYIPKDFDLNRFFGAIFKFAEIIQHNKYANNYDYHKAIYLLNRDELIENGFLLLRENNDLFSPVGVLHYERYDDVDKVKSDLIALSDSIQCIVGHNYIPFGQAQEPRINDFADGVNTMEFLEQLN